MSEATQLIAELRRQGVHPTGISADSRQIGAGEVFVAMPGVRSDGRDYIATALARGAAGVLWERNAAGGEMPGIGVPNIGVVGLPGLCGELAHHVYGRPSERLWMVGITGTNGKTTVSQLFAQAYTALGRKCGIIGTLGNGFPGGLQDSLNTTPDAITVHRTLAGLLAAGARACAMEVSSIGLDQGRVNAVEFDIAVITNLTRDHLDYHGSMENYAGAKRRLFRQPGLQAAVLNLDDAFGRQLCAEIDGTGVRRIGYALGKPDDLAADEIVSADELRFHSGGLSFTAHTGQGSAQANAALFGRFNAANLLAVLASLLASGIALDQALAVLPQLQAPPGRLQVVAEEGRPMLVVDYAHTPDALEQVLTTLREIAAVRGGRLICLFGCGGERDPGKRPMMGEVAARLADAVIITSDNPRREDPQAIIDDILAGIVIAAAVEPDRAQAIRLAVQTALSRDVILFAGKGHEPYQEIAGVRLPFSDLTQAQAALSAWRGAA